jgi:hypothetical protein
MRISEASIEQRKSCSRDVLANAIERGHAILFAGAGVSMAVGLPSWRSLVDHLLKELDLRPDVIDGMNDGYQMLAEFYRLKQGGLGPLRSWLDRNWKVAADRVAESQLHCLDRLSFAPLSTSSSARTPWGAPFCLSDTACPIPTSGCYCKHLADLGKIRLSRSSPALVRVHGFVESGAGGDARPLGNYPFDARERSMCRRCVNGLPRGYPS